MTEGGGPTRNQRREHARELAQQRQAEEQRRRRRGRWLLQGGIGAAIVAIAVVVVLVVANSGNSASPTTAAVAGPANMATNGIEFHGVDGKVEPVLSRPVSASGAPAPVATSNADGATKVVTYIDWACPVCKQFEAQYSSGILDLVAQGRATLEVHPVSILDTHYGTSRYASRAANAAACVANSDPDDFLAVQNEFYEHQPAEGSNGLSNAQIRALVRDGGVTDRSVMSCIDSEHFRAWVTTETNRVLGDKSLVNSSGYFGTPTLLIDGKMWDQTSDPIADITRG
jgi:protein-disulfide isomerase